MGVLILELPITCRQSCNARTRGIVDTGYVCKGKQQQYRSLTIPLAWIDTTGNHGDTYIIVCYLWAQTDTDAHEVPHTAQNKASSA